MTREGGERNLIRASTGPVYSAFPLLDRRQMAAEILQVPGAPAPNSQGPSDDDVGHMVNWLQAMQTR